MLTLNETNPIDTIAAHQRRMLSANKRPAWIATVLTIAALGINALVDYQRAGFWIFTALMVLFLVGVWTHYALTSYRIRKGYFGDNAAEALEEIEFIQNEHLHRGETIKK